MDRRGFLKALAAIPAAALVPLPGVASPAATTTTVVSGVAFQVGDIFTISGVYQINPMTHESTGREQQFVVSATSDSGGDCVDGS